jgi:D-alanyl-D-alanine carboxypeptidase/D-alanyl-D-alanine-endopeptidase (penicillin-binding protein 4)
MMFAHRRYRVAAIGASVVLLAACTSNAANDTPSSASPTASPSAATVSGAAAASSVQSAGTSASGSAPSSASAQAAGQYTSVPGLDQAALDVMNKPVYGLGQWAIAVRDLDTGEQIVSLNAGTMFEPGSMVKTYSTGAAWLEFGPTSTVVTPVKQTGTVTDGKLNGDLLLVGAGDLTMGGRTRPDGTVDFTNLDHNDANGIPGATLTTEDPLTGLNELAAQVKASGITEVSGNVIVDDRLWQPHTLADGPVSPIIINQNVIDFTTTPTKPGEVATSVMSPVVAPWVVKGEVKTVEAGGTTNIKASSPEEGTVVLSGTIAADSKPVVNVYAFKDPATYARTAFIEALKRAGVSVTADPVGTNPAAKLPPKQEVSALPAVAKLTSLPLEEEVTYVNKISYNVGGETLLCRLAVAAGSDDCEQGLPRAAEIWKKAGLDTTSAALVDGSGLSGNLITPDNQVQLQSIMAKRPDAEQWKSTLPVLGVDGSLALVQADSPAKGKVIGKTGTLAAFDDFNGRYRLPVKALGGYMETKSGRQFAFAVIATNSVYPDVNGVFSANDDVGKVVASIQQSY